MNTDTLSAYQPPQKLHLLSLLAQMTSQQATGCLLVSDGSTTWALYLEQGKLIYASSSLDPFGRLERYLRQYSDQNAALMSAVWAQVRLMFESAKGEEQVGQRDYEAICWLVRQEYLTNTQAASLVETIAVEVMETLLLVQKGTYGFTEHNHLQACPKLCYLSLRSVVEAYQKQMYQRQATRNQNSAISQSISPSNLQDVEASTNGKTRHISARPKSVDSLTYPPHSSVQKKLNSVKETAYTIACIDDSPTVLKAIEAFLDDQAFRVIGITNPVSALMQVIRNKPDLILLDVTMPSLDGYELCSLLRRHPTFKQTPIIMVTGNTGFVDRAKAKIAGASGYLAKPFTQSDLLKMIFRYLT